MLEAGEQLLPAAMHWLTVQNERCILQSEVCESWSLEELPVESIRDEIDWIPYASFRVVFRLLYFVSWVLRGQFSCYLAFRLDLVADITSDPIYASAGEIIVAIHANRSSPGYAA